MGVCYWILTITVLCVSVLVGLLTTGLLNRQGTLPPPQNINWWSKSPKPAKEDTAIRKFVIDVPDASIKDLKARISNFKPVAPLVDAKFNYGFNGDFLYQTIVPYWRDKYDWKRQQAELNKYPQFKTSIGGLQIHFLHVKPDPKKYSDPSRVRRLLIVHGWPGSVYEFYKIIPMLTDPLSHGGREDDVFEVICPSIPGYAFSDPPQIQGFNIESAAHIFASLMSRLGIDSYYVQGGDWGAEIVQAMALYHKDHILGVHTNMLAPPDNNVDYLLRMMIGWVAPSLVNLHGEVDYAKVYPALNITLNLLSEAGYMWIQATKPDTVGAALHDSPVGLAAYILEKFSTWTDMRWRDEEDGGLTRGVYTLDELLTNVMIYWVTDSITTSQRFYKENFKNSMETTKHLHSVRIDVPVGYAAFPHELLVMPRDWAERYRCNQLVHYSDMPTGGHFAAFQVPQLLASDVRKFVRKVEESKLYFAGHFSSST